jgi:hypothetical protein
MNLKSYGRLAVTLGVLGAALVPAAAMAGTAGPVVQPTAAQAQLLADMEATPLAILGQTGYDGYLCGAPDTGIAIRKAPNDGAEAVGRMHNGDPLHVYRTHAGDASIPAGWDLGYGRPGGGAAVDGYFKNYVCR